MLYKDILMLVEVDTVTCPHLFRSYLKTTRLSVSDLSGVLSSEAALESRAAAFNQTAADLQPALRFFITASALQGAPGRANVVGFTDTREMLKPFHALKYLADNFLEEYDFFFLVSDSTFVNARRLNRLVASLSVSQDLYMGAVSGDDTHYCTLEAGILMSNSVLRAVHEELDWCVRNSYSPHHHENLGRCVLHAAGLRCVAGLQAVSYDTAHLRPAHPDGPASLHPALADAVTVHPALTPEDFYRLHAYVSRVRASSGSDKNTVEGVNNEDPISAGEPGACSGGRGADSSGGRAQLPSPSPGVQERVVANRPTSGRRSSAATPTHQVRVPPAYNISHQAASLTRAPLLRFDLLRWTRFNLTHALQLDDHRAVSKLSASYKQAVAVSDSRAT